MTLKHPKLNGQAPTFYKVTGSTQITANAPLWRYDLERIKMSFNQVTKPVPSSLSIPDGDIDIYGYNIHEVGNTPTVWFGEDADDFEDDFEFAPCPDNRTVMGYEFPGRPLSSNGSIPRFDPFEEKRVVFFVWANQLSGTCPE